MIGCPAEPMYRDHLSATWMRSLVRYVRSITPLAGPGMKRHVTPNGTILTPAPSKGGKASFVSATPGCWQLADASREATTTDATTGETSATTEVYPTLINRYYSVGEIAAHMDEDVEIDLSDFILQGELQDDEEYTAADRPFICLEVLARPPEPEGGNESVRIVAFKDWSELVEAQRNLSVVVKPLYKLSHYGTIVVDYRNMPQMQMTEVV